MSNLILPNGLHATTIRETLSREEIDLVTSFERWCTRRNLTLDLFCKTCMDRDGLAGHEARLWGNNSRDALKYKISCPHADRVYGDVQ